MGYNGVLSGYAFQAGLNPTSFTDDFVRLVNNLSEEGHPWELIVNQELPIPGGTWVIPAASIPVSGTCNLGSFGPNNPAAGRSGFLIPTQLQNPLVWGGNQYSRLRMTARTFTAGGVDYTGPAVHVRPGLPNSGYIMAWVGSTQWYLIYGSNVLGGETVLIAPTNWTVAFPATWEVRVQVNTPVAGTNRVSTWINGAQVGSVDHVNIRSGIPAIYVFEQTSGGVSSFMDINLYQGGLL